MPLPTMAGLVEVSHIIVAGEQLMVAIGICFIISRPMFPARMKGVEKAGLSGGLGASLRDLLCQVEHTPSMPKYMKVM